MYTMQFEITGLGSESKQTVVTGREITIGKHATCDICLTDIEISRQHCRITPTTDGATVADLNSTNGLFFRGEQRTHFDLQNPSDVFEITSYAIRILRIDRPERCFIQDRGLKLLHDLHRQFVDTTDVTLLTDAKRTKAALTDFLSSVSREIPLWCDHQQLHARLMHEINGYGPLEQLFADNSITEIMVNGPKDIFVERAGHIQKTDSAFLNAASLMHCIQKIIAPIGRSIDEHRPMVDARIAGIARINAIIPPLSLIGPCLTVRKFSDSSLAMETLIEQEAISSEAVELVKLAVEKEQNIVVAGGTDTGKTTMLNILSHYIEREARIVTIEDTAEISLRQPHVVTLEARPANIEGHGAISIRDLLKNALRMRPDRLVIGECRGGETVDMLQAMNTGHDGCMTTVHANSDRDALARMEAMYMLSGLNVPIVAIRQQIAAAMDLILYMQRLKNGRRVVVSISEVCGMEGETILTQRIFARTKRGNLQPTGIVPRFTQT